MPKSQRARFTYLNLNIHFFLGFHFGNEKTNLIIRVLSAQTRLTHSNLILLLLGGQCPTRLVWVIVLSLPKKPAYRHIKVFWEVWRHFEIFWKFWRYFEVFWKKRELETLEECLQIRTWNILKLNLECSWNRTWNVLNENWEF